MILVFSVCHFARCFFCGFHLMNALSGVSVLFVGDCWKEGCVFV